MCTAECLYRKPNAITVIKTAMVRKRNFWQMCGDWCPVCNEVYSKVAVINKTVMK